MNRDEGTGAQPGPVRRARGSAPRRRTGRRAAALALLLSLGSSSLGACSRTRSDTLPDAAASAAVPPGPPVEQSLFPTSRSLLLDAPALALVPREAAGVLVTAGPSTLATLGPARLGEAPVREALAALARELGREFSKDLPDLGELAASGIDLTKPIGLALLDDEGLAMAAFASVADEAKLRKLLAGRRGSRKLVERDGALVLIAKRDATRAVVLRDGQLLVLRAGASWASARDDRVAEWATRIATLPAAESVAQDRLVREAAERVAWGKHVAGWLTPSLLGADEKARLLLPSWEEISNAQRERFASERKAIDEARAIVGGATRGLCFGVEAAARGVLVAAELVAPEGGTVPAEAPSPLPLALAELRDVNFELHVKTAPALLAAAATLDRELAVQFREPIECVLGARWSEDLTGEVVRLGGGTLALGVRETATQHWRARVEQARAETAGAPPGAAPSSPSSAASNADAKPARVEGSQPIGLELEEATGIAKCRGKRLRIAEGWLLLAAGDGLLRRFPAGAAEPGIGAGKAAAPLAIELRAVAPYRGAITLFPWPEPDDAGAERLSSMFDHPCAGLAGMLLFKSTKERAEERRKLCKELGEVEEAERQSGREAIGAIGRLLGRVELVAKPRGGALALFGAWHHEGKDLAALVDALLDAWLPIAPTSKGARAASELRARLEALDEKAREEAFGQLLDVGDLSRPSFADLLGASEPAGLGGLGGPGSRGAGVSPGSGRGGGIGIGGGGLGSRGASSADATR